MEIILVVIRFEERAGLSDMEDTPKSPSHSLVYSVGHINPQGIRLHELIYTLVHNTQCNLYPKLTGCLCMNFLMVILGGIRKDWVGVLQHSSLPPFYNYLGIRNYLSKFLKKHKRK